MKLIKLIPLVAMLVACNKGTDLQTADVQIQAVKITEAWVRASAPGQSVGAAYMTLTSPQDSALVYAETPAADSVEIHSMSMDNGVMKMRMLDELALKAGKPENLAPGGFHLMLFGLQKPLKAGENINFRLCFKDKTNKITEQNVTLPVKEN